jgi:hypothetical protein
VSALANADVGDYLNQHFLATFQKIGSFRVVGNQKQGGNVASYFCTPDGGVLDAIAGPVDASTFLREARWVVETRKMALLDSGGDATRYLLFFRMAHAQRLADEDGVADVYWQKLPLFQPSEALLISLLDHDHHVPQLNQQGRVHLLLAAFPLVKLDQAYRVIYEKILNEQVTTAPVVEGNQPLPGAAGRSPKWRSAPAPAALGRAGRSGTDPELAGTLSPEDARRKARARELNEALDSPPLTDVCSGRALNVLLADLAQRQGDSGADPQVALPAEVLAHINVSAVSAPADAGLLRDGGRLPWPLVWREAPLRKDSQALRAAMDRMLGQAVAQAKKGAVHEDVLERLHRDRASLKGVLAQDVKELTASQDVQAKRFLGEVDDALKVLEGNDAGRYVGGPWRLDPGRIKTVADMVRFMTDQGLKFAPAVTGDEVAYGKLRRSLAACEENSHSLLSAADGGHL